MADKDVATSENEVSSADNESAAITTESNKRATRAKKVANKEESPAETETSSADNENALANGASKKRGTRAKATATAGTKNGVKDTKETISAGSDISKDEQVVEPTEKSKPARGAKKTQDNNDASEIKPKATRSRKPAATKATEDSINAADVAVADKEKPKTRGRKPAASKASEDSSDKATGIPDAGKEKPKGRGRKPAAAKVTEESAVKVTKESANEPSSTLAENTDVKPENDGEKAPLNVSGEPIPAAVEKTSTDEVEQPSETTENENAAQEAA